MHIYGDSQMWPPSFYFFFVAGQGNKCMLLLRVRHVSEISAQTRLQTCS